MNKLLSSKFWWAFLLLILIGINYLASFIHYRLDLTQEKRFTLSKPTRNLLRTLNDKVSVTVFLDGSMPAGFKKLRNSIQELLQEFKEIGKSDIQFRFIKPGSDSGDSSVISSDSLLRLGLKPTNVHVQAKQGEAEENRYLFPGALLSYKDRILPVDFLEWQDMTVGVNTLNTAEALIEYKLSHAIQKIMASS